MTGFGGARWLAPRLGALVLCVLLAVHAQHAAANSNDSLESILERAKAATIAGNYPEALEHYNTAVAADPSSYVTLFKRATVLSALGRTRHAVADFDTVLGLKPDFNQARSQRAALLLKQGKADLARADFGELTKIDPNDQHARAQLAAVDTYLAQAKAGSEALKRHDFAAALGHLTAAIDIAPMNEELRRLRADAYIGAGDIQSAIGDVTRSAKLSNDNSEAFFLLSKLYYQTGDLEQALKQVRECLKLDAEHKSCHPLYKKLRMLDKHLQAADQATKQSNFEQAITKLDAAAAVDQSMVIFQVRILADKCRCYLRLRKPKEVVTTCAQVLALDANHFTALVDTAEAYLLLERYEDAVNTYQRAKSAHGDNQEIVQGLDRAQKLLKQANTRDYYKILSVARNADKKDIIKAYRREAMIWHPDKYDGEEKVAAEKRFIDIAAAKEVLTDDEKRKMYDSGNDPLDPEVQRQQQQQGFHHGGFNPFGGQQFHQQRSGGNPFNFNFHF
ncbi:protein kinase inhibitor p58 [Capsaspora owczarzaki ATCC 30864]|uniref:Protein kinase inhibitor p58 n=1 Tax=Capsaspora owczarzaki (strain ATCC 30864) TaxID=595528 RepID=A0A0D2U457_CAPO3|nr:protein kinase inhibitor p58 [Capsaspora owczarzaki ATCC 30864]KJE89961.1 protein kinase inhibitor p58 [Capsaspora owczarzaki ATCC 30864]|eukprot:XP_004349874.1 protein kinase inhibitor p58 [Capsaspora owczarzaki ATCC 30864]